MAKAKKKVVKKKAAKKEVVKKAPARAVAARPKAKPTRESAAARQQRALRLLNELRQAYPDADCALRHNSAFELLVATILSAQCTDERVNMVTPDLMRRYPDPATMAAADADDVEALIRSTGFFRNKTKSLLACHRRFATTSTEPCPTRWKTC